MTTQSINKIWVHNSISWNSKYSIQTEFHEIAIKLRWSKSVDLTNVWFLQCVDFIIYGKQKHRKGIRYWPQGK